MAIGGRRGGVKVDNLLSNLSSLVIQRQDAFIAPKVFSIVPVDFQSDLYPVYNADDWNIDEAQERKDSTETAGSGYSMSDEAYKCRVFGIHKDIGDQLQANTPNMFNLKREAMEFVTRKILLKEERRFVDTFMQTGVWGEDLVGVTDFDQFNESTSSPIKVFKAEMKAQLEKTGIEPNTLVFGYDVFNELTEHPDFVDRVKYSSSDAVTQDIMARLIGIGRILVAKSIVATGKGATKTTGFNFSRNALLCYANPNPGLLTPSAGYMFSWNFAGIQNNGAPAIKSWYIQEKETTRVEGQVAFDMKVIAEDLGSLFTEIVPAPA